MIDATVNGTPGFRWKLRISAIVWFVLAVGFLICVPSLWALNPLIVLAVAAVAIVLAPPGAWLVRRLFRRQRLQRFWVSLLKAAVALFFTFTIIVAAPVYYLALRTDLAPMTVPQATLTNGTKTVVFQGMMHVGSESFYKSVVYDLEKALVDGYVLYYEGIMPSPEGDAWFSQTLAGGGDLSDNYKMLADVCGLRFQLDYFRLLVPDMTAHPERHITADVTTADMMHEYERLVAADPGFAERVAGEAEPAPADGDASPDLFTNLLHWIQQGDEQQRQIGGMVCRGFMTMVTSGTSAPSALDPVILDYRNRALAERIENETNPLIYITYGAGHLPGLLATLQGSDPAWEIASLKWMQPIEGEDELEGQL